MNDILQQQIDSISQANAKIDEFLAAGAPGQNGENYHAHLAIIILT